MRLCLWFLRYSFATIFLDLRGSRGFSCGKASGWGLDCRGLRAETHGGGSGTVAHDVIDHEVGYEFLRTALTRALSAPDGKDLHPEATNATKDVGLGTQFSIRVVSPRYFAGSTNTAVP